LPSSGEPSEPRVESGGGARFRGGLFIASIEFHPERVVFNVFTSRPTPYAELAERLTLHDNLGTDYTLQPFEEIDGKGTFHFTPGIPSDAKSWHLGKPGRSLFWATLDPEA